MPGGTEYCEERDDCMESNVLVDALEAVSEKAESCSDWASTQTGVTDPGVTEGAPRAPRAPTPPRRSL